MKKAARCLPHPRQIEAMVAVARTGSMHAAARLLGIPQPALSRLIAALETSLGVALFHRSPSGTRTTEVGERLLTQGAFALQALESVLEAARESFPVVRLGCIPRVMHVFIPRLLALISDGNPGFRLRVSVGTSNERAEELDAARVDFVIARRASPGVAGAAELCAEKLYAERSVVVCGRANDDVPRSTCHIRDLIGLPWVLPKRGFHSRDLLDSIIAARGLPPIVPIIESNSFESSLSAVALTRFLTIAPEFAARRFEQLTLVRIVRMRPTLAATPIMLEYCPAQEAHPTFNAFRTLTLVAARMIGAH